MTNSDSVSSTSLMGLSKSRLCNIKNSIYEPDTEVRYIITNSTITATIKHYKKPSNDNRKATQDANLKQNKALFNYAPYSTYGLGDLSFDRAWYSRSLVSDISKNACRKISKYLTAWIECVQTGNEYFKHKANKHIILLTLTLSSDQVHTDKLINRKCLTPFLQQLKRLHQCKNIFWRAEAQENNRIHYHLLLDQYIDKDEVRDLWNQAQNNLGYIDAYEEEKGSRNPPSTKIEEIFNKKDAVAYVTKYVAKGSKYRFIDSRVWGCTDSIREMQSFEYVDKGDLLQKAEKEKNKGSFKSWEHDYCIKYNGLMRKFLFKSTPLLYRMKKEYEVDQFKHLYFKNEQRATISKIKERKEKRYKKPIQLMLLC